MMIFETFDEEEEEEVLCGNQYKLCCVSCLDPNSMGAYTVSNKVGPAHQFGSGYARLENVAVISSNNSLLYLLRTDSQHYAWSRHLFCIALEAGIYCENKRSMGNRTPANRQSYFSILLVYGLNKLDFKTQGSTEFITQRPCSWLWHCHSDI